MKRKSTLRGLKKKAWKLFSEWIRRKDADEGGTVSCYTCGGLFFWKDVHAGHAIPGRTNSVLFDPDIVKPQCPVDNIWKGGQYHIFATKLIKEHGMEWWDKKLIDSRKVVKYTAADLEDLIMDLKQKLEKLNAMQVRSTDGPGEVQERPGQDRVSDLPMLMREES